MAEVLEQTDGQKQEKHESAQEQAHDAKRIAGSFQGSEVYDIARVYQGLNGDEI
jgi:hypothetical protein